MNSILCLVYLLRLAQSVAVPTLTKTGNFAECTKYWWVFHKVPVQCIWWSVIQKNLIGI